MANVCAIGINRFYLTDNSGTSAAATHFHYRLIINTFPQARLLSIETTNNWPAVTDHITANPKLHRILIADFDYYSTSSLTNTVRERKTNNLLSSMTANYHQLFVSEDLLDPVPRSQPSPIYASNWNRYHTLIYYFRPRLNCRKAHVELSRKIQTLPLEISQLIPNTTTSLRKQ